MWAYWVEGWQYLSYPSLTFWGCKANLFTHFLDWAPLSFETFQILSGHLSFTHGIGKWDLHLWNILPLKKNKIKYVKHITRFVWKHYFHMSKWYGGRKRKRKKGSIMAFIYFSELHDPKFLLHRSYWVSNIVNGLNLELGPTKVQKIRKRDWVVIYVFHIFLKILDDLVYEVSCIGVYHIHKNIEH